MPPAVSGDTSPAASPTSTTSRPAKGWTVPPTGISPPRMPTRRARAKSRCESAREEAVEFRPGGESTCEPDLRETDTWYTHPM